MAVQQEIKSQLAKLLATEDLVVEHKQVQTAQFNVHSRVLTLPLWERASGTVYDMLVGHEVGHALYTPDEWGWRDRIPQQFVNVVEDARIEKLMKRKYMGIAKTFYRGYNELNDKDFFEIENEDITTFNLADRANLYFKVGSWVDLDFSDTEKEIIGLIGKCETFDDTLKAAEVLYQYCKKQQEQKKDDLKNPPPQQKSDFNLDSEGQTDEGEQSEVESPQTPQMQESGSTESNVQEEFDIPEPEVKTAESLEERLQELVNDNGVENIYVEIPKVNLDTIIAKNSDIHDVIDESFIQQEVDFNIRKENSDSRFEFPETVFDEVDSDFIKFKKDAQKEVNYLVKEFECRKAASSYARAATSRTGVLDTAKLHTYRYNEDLFKKITVLPDGKNHGLVFVLDWSGSMQYVLEDTVKQLYNLVWFCRKVSIPFEVYAFTNEWIRGQEGVKEHYEAKENLLQVHHGFNLMNILTSKVNAKTLEHQMLNIWRIAQVFGEHCYGYSYPNRLCLSGTPLNEALITLNQILPQFQKENGVEKVQCIVLTDGEASQIPYHKEVERHWEDSPYMGTRHINPESVLLRDRSLGTTYRFGYAYHEFTSALLRNLQDRFKSVNFIGIRVLPNRDALRFARLYYSEYCKEYQVIEKDWKKSKSFNIKNSAYDAYFAMSSSNLADEAEFEPKSDSKADIKRAFVKSLKVKKLNKKVLGEFIELVA